MTRSTTTIRIHDRQIGPGQPCLIIAEAGVNHNGEVSRAHALVDEAAKAGADVVKFQTFSAKAVVAAGAAKATYQQQNTGGNETQLAMLQRLELSADDFRGLHQHCLDRGVIFLSTPFDLPSVDLLVSLGSLAIKISSGEVTHTTLLRHVAKQNLPVFVSTGMSTLDEVARCVGTLRDAGQHDVALLHCLSNYPADPAEVNLRAMNTMAERFGVPVGFSDHTMGTAVAMAAVAMGATIIEKHFTLDRTLPGPDHKASLEPREFVELVRGIRAVEQAMGDGVKRPMPSEMNVREVARRSLVAARDLPVGHVLREQDILALRPGTGIPADALDTLIGRTLVTPITAGQMLRESDYGD